jgi:hypothetical protein
MTCLVPRVGGSAASLLGQVAKEDQVQLTPDVRTLLSPFFSCYLSFIFFALVAWKDLAMAITSAAGFLTDTLLQQEEGWMHHDDIPSTARIVYSDLPREQAEELSRKFQCHSAISFGNELTYAGYKDVPSSFLFCEEDLTVPPYVQQLALDAIQEGGNAADVTRIQASHCPQDTALEDVIAWVVDVAKKAV